MESTGLSSVAPTAPIQQPLVGADAAGAPGRDIACASYFRYKAVLGRLLAAVLLVPALPVIGLLVLVVRLTSRGPGLYRQRRVGRDGRIFTLYKIRTMRVDAESATGPVWTEQDDPRITPVGRFLRRLHLDELPQLLNVLYGDMSLIGPRPERPEFTEYLCSEIPGYMARYRVLPGVTGLAQISLPPDNDVESVRRKLVLDLEYIRTASLGLDLRIALCTGLKMLGFPGMRIAGWLKLWRNPQLPDWMRRPPGSNGTPRDAIVPKTYSVRAEGASPPGNGAPKKPR